MSRTLAANRVANRVASLYPLRSLQSYVRWKARIDLAYDAVFQLVKDRDDPLVDLGCGVGILPFYLRESGFRAPVIGIDHDPRKIELARSVAQRYRGIDFVLADARAPLPEGHTIVLLDVLQYVDPQAQQQILRNVAHALRSGGTAILRQGVRDESWRYRMSSFADAFGRLVRWMRAESLTFPTRQEIASHFDGFTHEITPLWGRSPYNNYLFVFRKEAFSGITKS